MNACHRGIHDKLTVVAVATAAVAAVAAVAAEELSTNAKRGGNGFWAADVGPRRLPTKTQWGVCQPRPSQHSWNCACFYSICKPASGRFAALASSSTSPAERLLCLTPVRVSLLSIFVV